MNEYVCIVYNTSVKWYVSLPRARFIFLLSLVGYTRFENRETLSRLLVCVSRLNIFFFRIRL